METNATNGAVRPVSELCLQVIQDFDAKFKREKALLEAYNVEKKAAFAVEKFRVLLDDERNYRPEIEFGRGLSDALKGLPNEDQILILKMLLKEESFFAIAKINELAAAKLKTILTQV